MEAEEDLIQCKIQRGDNSESSKLLSSRTSSNFSIEEPPCKKIKTIYTVTTSNPETRDRKLTCYTCGKENHSSRNCPDRFIKQKPPARSNPYPAKERSRCSHCQKLGHVASTCLLRRLEEAERRLQELQQPSSLTKQVLAI